MLYNFKVHVFPDACLGWSTDIDHLHYENVLKELGYCVTESLFTADILYLVNWNHLMDRRVEYYRTMRVCRRLFRKTKIVATISNDLHHHQQIFDSIKRIPDVFVYANQQQKDHLIKFGIAEHRLFYNPFYVDEKLFSRSTIGKTKLAKQLGIDPAMLAGKFLIGSFQRDSLGADLTCAKWQKNPGLLIEIISKLPKDNILLLLAGPRRHYVIDQCVKKQIPFIFVGDSEPIRKGMDDIEINILPLDKMSLLYNLTDLYIVSSTSEGGPKAVIESSLTNTLILSTRVGFAEDFLVEDCLYKTSEEAIYKIMSFMNDVSIRQEIISKNQIKTSQINNRQAFVARLRLIMEFVTST